MEWRRGEEVLRSGEKYQMRKKDQLLELKITNANLEDSGEYTCVCGEQRTTASVIVNGRRVTFPVLSKLNLEVILWCVVKC